MATHSSTSQSIIISILTSFNNRVFRDKKHFLLCNNFHEWTQKKQAMLFDTHRNLLVVNYPATQAYNQIILAKTFYEISTMAWTVAPVIALYGRVKSIQSTLSKMRVHGLANKHILDTIGVRVVFVRIEDCYRLVKQIHKRYTFIENEYNDYIKIPKPSGYQSLHTTILASSKLPIEIQIRTQKMHALAENGSAAHWLYKQRS